MVVLLQVFQRGIELADRIVLGQRQLSKTSIDLRTLICFGLFVGLFLFGMAVVGPLDADWAEFGVWVVVSTPLALVFLARHQRLNI